MAEFDEFALHAPVPPTDRIVHGDADHGCGAAAVDGRPGGEAGVVPLADDPSPLV